MYYTIYNEINGWIDGNIQCPLSQLHAQLKSGYNYIEGVYDDALYYIDLTTKIPVKKKYIPYSINKSKIKADNQDTAIIKLPTKEPNNNNILVNVTCHGKIGQINDGVIKFSTNVSGLYKIKLEATNYLTTYVTIEVE